MILIANLKCNHTRTSFSHYVKILNDYLSRNSTKMDIIVFPPATAFNEVNGFIQGAQNFYPCSNGAFSGEIGKDMLDEFGINTVLIGHSERRAMGESEEILAQKFNFAKLNNMRVVYCVGESLNDYQARKSIDIILAQISNIDLDYKNLIIAYEPIYSIGSGISARNADIQKILNAIKKNTNRPLLYGGSVNANNISQILSIKNCSGVLVGSASWNVNSFINLIDMVKNNDNEK